MELNPISLTLLISWILNLNLTSETPSKTGLVNARSHPCFSFIKLVPVLEHLNIDIGRPSPVASHPYPYLNLISDK